jgi:hypothetical protein
MQLDATTRTPCVAQAKSGARGNLDVADAPYFGVAGCFITSIVNERYMKPHSQCSRSDCFPARELSASSGCHEAVTAVAVS